MFLFAPVFVSAELLLAGFRGHAAFRRLDQEPASAETAQPPQQPEPAQQPPQAEPVRAGQVTRETLHGVVRNAATGEPLPRALVRIEGDADAGALTDGQGRFEIPAVPVGPQAIQVRKPGFRERPFAIGEETDLMDGPAHNVVVATEMQDLVFTLAPTGSIQGAIELSTGEPGQGIEVQLVRRGVSDGRGVWQAGGVTKTNSEGRFRFAGLVDGVYALYTEPSMETDPTEGLGEGSRGAGERLGYASVFYPDAREPGGAASIRVRGGEQVQTNMTLTLEPFHAVAAVVSLPHERSRVSAGAAPGYNAVVMDEAGHQLSYQPQFDQRTHTILVVLPDGSYSLLVTSIPQLRMGTSRVNVSSGTDRGPEMLAGTVDFSVAGRDVQNLRVPLSVPHPNPVQLKLIRSAGQAASDQNGLNLVMVSRAGGWIDDGVMSAYANGTGSGPMEAVYTPPGPYWVHTHVGLRGFCEASFTAGGANLAREPVIISLSGSTVPMELGLRDDCAALRVNMPETFAAIVPGEEPFYTVYVVPEFDFTKDLEPITLRLSTGGSMILENLTPGNYHVYIFQGAVRLEYRNPAVLAALHGQVVTLSPGAVSDLVLEVRGR
jgi:hypothetical protein